MNIPKIVDLYTQTLQVDNAEIFLRRTDKELWAQLRIELRDSSRGQRVAFWEDQLGALVEKRYKAAPNAFIVKRYRGKSTYAEMWRIKRAKAKWRFVNIFRIKLPTPEKHLAVEPSREVEIRGTITKDGTWDVEAIATLLASLMSQVPEDMLERATAQARKRVGKVKAA